MSLTAEQNAIVTAPYSVVVTAGAGTGKTTMLTHRYCYYVLQQGVSPLNIVAVTFTKKAAAELKRRIRQQMQAEAACAQTHLAALDVAPIETFHALCTRICKEFGLTIGLRPDFTVLDEQTLPIWQTEQLQEALLAIPLPDLEPMPYSQWLSLLTLLQNDPAVTRAALQHNPENWHAWFAAAQQQAVARLREHPQWMTALATLSEWQGSPGDKVEENRQVALEAMRALMLGEAIAQAAETIQQLNMVGGSAKKWPNGGFELVKETLKMLRDMVKRASTHDLLTLAWTHWDDDLKAIDPAIHNVYQQVILHLERAKQQQNVLTFADLEQYALRILQQPAVQQRLHQRWRVFLLDEFQDTNPTQLALLQALAPEAQHTIVGDDKQSIYSFRGADVSCFEATKQWITQQNGMLQQINLSFRTHAGLVTPINQIFQHLMPQSHQSLQAFRAACLHHPVALQAVKLDCPTSMLKQQRLLYEAEWIAQQVKHLMAESVQVYDKQHQCSRPVEYGDIAILSRTWGPLEVIAQTLEAAGIPTAQASGGNLLKTREAMDVLALLTFLADPLDDLALLAVLRSPFFAIDDPVLASLQHTRTNEAIWWSHLQRSPHTHVQQACLILQEALALRAYHDPSDIVQQVVLQTRYSDVIAALPQGKRRYADWQGILHWIRELEQQHRDVCNLTRRFHQLLQADVSLPRLPLEAGNAVTLNTIHGAKGLEWPIVMIPDLARKSPGNKATVAASSQYGVAIKLRDDAGDWQKPGLIRLIEFEQQQRDNADALRLLYVAFTRAQDRLYLSSNTLEGGLWDSLLPGLTVANIPISVVSMDSTQRQPISAVS